MSVIEQRWVGTGFELNHVGTDDVPTTTLSYVSMGSKLERVTHSVILRDSTRIQYPHWNYKREVQDAMEYLTRCLKESCRGKGILDESSIEFTTDYDYDRKGEILRIHANLMVPYSPPPTIIKAEPKKYYCDHCDSVALEDEYHSGTCENCGAPFPKP